MSCSIKNNTDYPPLTEGKIVLQGESGKWDENSVHTLSIVQADRQAAVESLKAQQAAARLIVGIDQFADIDLAVALPRGKRDLALFSCGIGQGRPPPILRAGVSRGQSPSGWACP